MLEPTGDEELDAVLTTCPWVIRAQLIFAPSEAISEYFMVVSLLGTIAPESPAILDVVTSEFIERETLDTDFLAEDALPNESFLYAKILYDDDDAPGGLTMIATQGLLRCGLPELEVVGVPVEQQHAAAVVLDVTVGLALEAGLPDPGGTFALGTGLEVILMPAAQASAGIKAGEVGSTQWRHKLETEGQFDTSQPHACLCQPSSAAGEQMGWPSLVAAAMLAGDASVFVSATARHRLGMRARRSFSAFATAFASLARPSKPEWVRIAHEGFMVQIAESSAPASGGAVQSWWRVDHLDGDGVDALRVARGSADAIDHRRIDSTDVMDWRVELPVEGSPFGPWEPDALLAAVDKVRTQESP
ncbi:MAG: hypothetical protein EXS00_05715 [Phycisphaerales bacterium]|nr:hypothetical protein [Phycisphaerales bacterium]